VSDSRIQLSNGVLFDLLEPDPELIDIEVIAASLSKLCRFTGHSSAFYSVAQHCVVVSRLVPAELALHGLLHDASEAFVGDVATPLKALLPEYKAIEIGIELAIAERFGFDISYSTVKQADLTAMAMERRDLGLPGNDEYWQGLPAPAPWTIHPLVPEDARVAFLARFAEIHLRPGQGAVPAPVVKQPDPKRFESNEDTSERLAREEEEQQYGEWEVIG
jgi:hypothetical protein